MKASESSDSSEPAPKRPRTVGSHQTRASTLRSAGIMIATSFGKIADRVVTTQAAHLPLSIKQTMRLLDRRSRSSTEIMLVAWILAISQWRMILFQCQARHFCSIEWHTCHLEIPGCSARLLKACPRHQVYFIE